MYTEETGSMNAFSGLFSIFGILFAVVSLLIFAVIVSIIVAMIVRNRKNNASPILTVDATVVAKRTSVSGNGTNNMGAFTYYYTTFQVESGDRIELSVSGSEYGMLAEGDTGRLTFQGTRYIGFERR